MPVGGGGWCKNACGMVYELTASRSGTGGEWSQSALYDFGDQRPGGGLIFDKKGNLYGIANGYKQYGTVFKLTRANGGLWKKTDLYKFKGGSDGSGPDAALVFDKAGNLYGTTGGGGTFGNGTVFELTPNSRGPWTETVLYSFTGGTDGSGPGATLILDDAGNLYGTTQYGGSGQGQAGFGVVFEIVR